MNNSPDKTVCGLKKCDHNENGVCAVKNRLISDAGMCMTDTTYPFPKEVEK